VPPVRFARRASVLALAALAACSPASAPEEIALDFWTAVEQRDAEAAARFADADAAAISEALAGFAPPHSAAIGEAVVRDGRARVETVFLVGERPAPLRIDTHLELADGAWRVDLDATAEELARARAASPSAPAR
jgi:hypothetical protein